MASASGGRSPSADPDRAGLTIASAGGYIPGHRAPHACGGRRHRERAGLRARTLNEKRTRVMKTARFSGGRRGTAWILTGAVGVLLQGCVGVIPRAPNVALVEEMGVEDAKQKLRETLSRAVQPRVNGVDVTDDFLKYRWDEGLYGVYGVPLGAVP